MVSVRVRREQVAESVGRGRSHRQSGALLVVGRSPIDVPLEAGRAERAGPVRFSSKVP